MRATPEALDAFNRVDAKLAEIGAMRSRAWTLAVPVGESIGFYTSTIAALLEAMDGLARLNRDPSIAKQFLAYQAVIRGKEERVTRKGFDTFCPVGPWIVTEDEIGDGVSHLQGRLWVNGEIKQDANTRDMIFPVDVIIETLSHGLTLEAGDIISSGTPEGVGMGRTPKEFLQDGDVVETEVVGVGRMRNPVVER